MTDLWWSCKTCGHESYDGPSALHHTQDTGHDGHALVTTDCGAGPGSSDAGRAAAMTRIKAQIDDARRRHQESAKGGRA
jgi:hypothetical protein